jgi:NAD dependent epimerase/dehydratase
MSWTGRGVLVTGAGGFIGSHLVETLAAAGARVRAFVRYTSRQDPGLLRFVAADLRSSIAIVAGDLRDPDAVRAAARDVELIFHLGALIAIPYSYRHPREVVESNVLGTLNVLEAAQASGAGCVIHTSTSEVYGTARSELISEEHPRQAQSPYSASKIGGDGLVTAYWRSFELPVVTVRPFNAYGPRQSARAVIPTIICQALARDEVRLGSLEPTRDYTFVTDTVAGFMAVAEAYPKLLGEEINLGSGTDISIGDLAARILRLVGRRLPIVLDAERVRPSGSEVMRLCADTSRARERLGWEPAVTLDEGLARTIRWVGDHPDLYSPGEYAV